MNIEVAETIVAVTAATAATRKMVGSRAEPDPVPLLDMITNAGEETDTVWGPSGINDGR
jgi:hypothetical protein